jgi:hypothetical protein
MFIGFDALGFSAIGEAPEDRFLLGGDSAVTLDWEVRIYSATHEYITRLADTPSTQAFLGTLQKAFRFDRSILGADRIGEEITIGLGEVTLNNSEGDYDFLAVDHTPKGQRIIIRMGDRRRPKSEWKTILNGYMTDLQIDRETITFRLRDAGYQLDVPASPSVYLGTGGAEGGDDLKNKTKPIGLGWNNNVSPPLVIPASLSYQLHDGQIHQVTKVYVRGVEMVFHADYADIAALEAASLSIGEYATCLALGWIRIAVAAGTELGQVTCDFAGDKTGGVFVETTADCVRRLINKSTSLVDPDDLVDSSFDTLNTAQPAEIGYYIPVGSSETVARAVARMMAGIGGWCGAKRSGRLEVKRFTAPSGASTGSYTRFNIVPDVKLAQMPTDLSPPPWRVNIGYDRNNTIQTDLADSVSATRRAYLEDRAGMRIASAESNAIRIDFPPGHELIKTDTFFRDEADAAAEATRLLALYGTSRALYVFRLCEPLFTHELGQNVTLTRARFDLTAGKLARIVKLTEDDVEGVEMTVFT